MHARAAWSTGVNEVWTRGEGEAAVPLRPPRSHHLIFPHPTLLHAHPAGMRSTGSFSTATAVATAPSAFQQQLAASSAAAAAAVASAVGGSGPVEVRRPASAEP